MVRLLRWLLSWFLPWLPRSAILLDYPSPEVEPSPPVVEPSPSPSVVEPSPPPPVSSFRAGVVRLDGRAFADDGGQFAALGASLFWALWASRHDQPKLIQALDWLSSHGVVYVRVLSMVGSQPYWDGRRIDPRWDDYDEVLFRLLDACSERGLRVQVVLFADAQVMMPDHSDRRDWVKTMASRLETRRHAIQFVEIANESRLNGVNDTDLADLTMRWAAHSEIPVAPSSPNGSGDPEAAINALWSDHTTSIAYCNLLTPHFQRRVDTAEGPYRPHRQPWEVQFYNTTISAFCSNEPVGPGSSGASESDPARLAIGAATSWICGACGYVLHSAAGIRGDVTFEESVSVEIMDALRSVRDLLPGSIANGDRHNHHWSGHPYVTIDQIWPDTNESGVVRAYASDVDGVFYVAVMGLRDHYEITARWNMTVEVFDVRTGAVLEVVELDRGDAWTFQQQDTLRDFVHRVTRR